MLEHTVGALITRFASKYIDNLDLSALRLSVFGGDVVLRNLELNLEVLRRDFAAGLPIEFQRGYVREIRIHIPWLKLASEPIELTIDTVELVASLLPPDAASGCPEEPAVSSGASTEAPAELGGGSASTDGWMGPLLTKALFNMSVRQAHSWPFEPVRRCAPPGRLVAGGGGIQGPKHTGPAAAPSPAVSRGFTSHAGGRAQRRGQVRRGACGGLALAPLD